MTLKSIITVAVDDSAELSTAQISELIHRAVPGTHALGSTEAGADLSDFEWDDDEPALPLGREDAAELSNNEGYVTVVTTVDQDEFIGQQAYGMTTVGADDQHDLLHGLTFAFGVAEDCQSRILAVSGSDFVVAYTTHVANQLQED